MQQFYVMNVMTTGLRLLRLSNKKLSAKSKEQDKLGKVDKSNSKGEVLTDERDN